MVALLSSLLHLYRADIEALQVSADEVRGTVEAAFREKARTRLEQGVETFEAFSLGHSSHNHHRRRDEAFIRCARNSKIRPSGK